MRKLIWLPIAVAAAIFAIAPIRAAAAQDRETTSKTFYGNTETTETWRDAKGVITKKLIQKTRKAHDGKDQLVSTAEVTYEKGLIAKTVTTEFYTDTKTKKRLTLKDAKGMLREETEWDKNQKQTHHRTWDANGKLTSGG